MPNAKDLQQSASFCGLFVGKSGTRKSSVAASFPKPMYSFDFDGRIQALRGMDIDYDQYPRTAGWIKAERKFESLLQEAKNGKLKYKTIHVASITTILDFFLWEATTHYEKETTGGLRINRPHNSGSKLLRDTPHYKFVHSALDDLLYEYILPLGMVTNVIVEAHEVTEYEKNGDAKGDKVLATPAISERLPTIFNETWQFKFKKSYKEGETDDYRIWFRNRDLAKTTHRELPDSMKITNRENVFYDEMFLPLISKS